MTTQPTCYYCNEPATTSEHIPPRGLFPDSEKYTYNLLSVPSCNKHNNKKSDLDNRMRLFLVGVSKKIHQDKDFKKLVHKVIRGTLRDVKTFNNFAKDSRIFRKKNKELTLINPNFENSEVNIVYGDHKFYQECILKGIYHKTYGDTWSKQLFIIPMSLVGFDEDFDVLDFAFGIQEFKDLTEKNLNMHSKHKVFQYNTEEVGELIIISVCLYMEYYFYGIFCDASMLQNIKNKFTPDSPVTSFNDAVYVYHEPKNVAKVSQ